MNQERVNAIIGENELTAEFLQTLKAEDLRTLGTDLFEFKGISRTKKADLIDMMVKAIDAHLEATDPRSDLEKFVASKDNQARAIALAMQIREAFERQWFTVRDFQLAIKAYRINKRKAIGDRLNEGVADSAEMDGLKKELFELDEVPVDSIDDLRIKLETLVLFSLIKRKADSKGKRPTKYKVVLTVIDRMIRAEAELKKVKEELDADTAE